jgi:hypothetical protein
MALRTADDGTRSAIFAAGALAVAVLSGCAAETSPPRVQARLPHEGFFLGSTEEEGLKLSYGVDETDNTTLMLECRPGSRRIELWDFGHAGVRRGQALILVSGKLQSSLTPTVETDDETGGVDVVAHTAPDLPALDGFRRSGEITLRMGQDAYALSATAAEKVQIARFFSGCEKR